MKELTKKVLESGLVDKHAAAMMERWGMIDRGSTEIVGTNDLRSMSKAQLESFTEDLAALIEKDAEGFKQTFLDIPIKSVKVVDIYFDTETIATGIPVAEDGLGRLVLPISEPVKITRGLDIMDRKDGRMGIILEHEELYQGDKVHAILLTVEWEQKH